MQYRNFAKKSWIVSTDVKFTYIEALHGRFHLTFFKEFKFQELWKFWP